ncbi:MAG: DUF3137 domain-containing protein [Bacteroidales bacterium]
MKSLEDLRRLYDSSLSSELKALESKRKGLLFCYILPVLVDIVLTVALIIYFKSLHPTLITTLSIAGVATFVFYIFMGGRAAKYRLEFKNKVVRKIVELLNPEWEYEANSFIRPSEYKKSELFTTGFDDYKGDDLIHGLIDKTDFFLSELHTRYKERSGKSETWHTIFKGLFAHADFNKEITTKTFVIPENANLFGKIGRKIGQWERGKLVSLENKEFSKSFAVYSQDQIEARYILTPVMMEAIVNLRKQFNKKIHISFVGSRVYVAIPFKKDLFEPKLYRSGVRYSDVETMYHQFNTISIIISEMNLNTRIWTKN